MGVNLNFSPNKYKAYYGKISEEISELISKERRPATIEDIMACRLMYGRELTDWLSQEYATSDAVIYHPDGKVKLACGASQLIASHKSNITKDGLMLPVEIYESINGQEYRKGFIEERYCDGTGGGKLLNREQVKNDPIWCYFTKDTKLLDNYVDFIYSRASESNCVEEIMGIQLSLSFPLSNSMKLNTLSLLPTPLGGSMLFECPVSSNNHLIGIKETK